MAKFDIYNLEAPDFLFENIKFERVDDYGNLWDKLRLGQNMHTFTALADDNLSVRPMMIVRADGEDDMFQFMNDICVLLSLAQSRRIFWPKYERGGVLSESYVFPFYFRSYGDVRIGEGHTEPYLDAAVRTIRQTDWTDKTGFVPSIELLLDSFALGARDASFLLAWIALEVLANANARLNKSAAAIIPVKKNMKMVRRALLDALGSVNEDIITPSQSEKLVQKLQSSDLNRAVVRDKITCLCDRYQWDFITDNLIGKWKELRDGVMHKGSHGGVDGGKVGDLCQRLQLAVQLALLDLLGCSQFTRNLVETKRRITSGS